MTTPNAAHKVAAQCPLVRSATEVLTAVANDPDVRTELIAAVRQKLAGLTSAPGLIEEPVDAVLAYLRGE